MLSQNSSLLSRAGVVPLARLLFGINQNVSRETFLNTFNRKGLKRNDNKKWHLL